MPVSRPQTSHAQRVERERPRQQQRERGDHDGGADRPRRLSRHHLLHEVARARRPSRRSGRTRSSAPIQSAIGFGRERRDAVGGAARRGGRAARRVDGAAAARPAVAAGIVGSSLAIVPLPLRRRSSADSARSDLELAPQRAAGGALAVQVALHALDHPPRGLVGRAVGDLAVEQLLAQPRDLGALGRRAAARASSRARSSSARRRSVSSASATIERCASSRAVGEPLVDLGRGRPLGLDALLGVGLDRRQRLLALRPAGPGAG